MTSAPFLYGGRSIPDFEKKNQFYRRYAWREAAMSIIELVAPKQKAGAWIVLSICILLSAASIITASLTQREFDAVRVSDVYFKNGNGIPVRAKLFAPDGATRDNPIPGMVYIHGYQNNRETGDAYSIETSRRGIVVLNIDAIGRGHSGLPGEPSDPGFDPTYGGASAVAFLKSLPYVRPDSVGIMGHSLGAEIAYLVALDDPKLSATVITGYGYTAEATPEMPRNMLMIIGQYDEFRGRMTGTRDIEKEWMSTQRTAKVFGVAHPKLSTTYGDFSRGTARRVFVPHITHVQESHNAEAIAETVEWLRAALNPPPAKWIDARTQIWQIKERATLAAMLAGFASLFPLALILIRLPFFAAIRRVRRDRYQCTMKDYTLYASINGILLWLYLPLILALFGIHKYVAPIHHAFPMMMVNAIVWWLLWVNVIGLVLFRRWYKRRARTQGVMLSDLGVSFSDTGFHLDRRALAKAFLLCALLFSFMYAVEFVAEKAFIVNYRFVYPFMNDLTPYRAGMMLLYWPFVLFCFLVTGAFLHGQIRRPADNGWLATLASRSGYASLALCLPLVLFLAVQYVPLWTTGFVPFVGPNGLFVAFVINLFPIVILFAVTAALSTWMHQLTGTVYAGAILNSLIITWVFASSQVIAPIPV
jgi:dienelactone hydrolase